MKDLNTRVIDLTLGELLQEVRECVKQAKGEEPEQPTTNKKFVYGLKGFASLLGCSKTTAARLKASGEYDEAITQIGALLIIDADKVIEIARQIKK